jgi:DNA polymerase-3 subunit delta'
VSFDELVGLQQTLLGLWEAARAGRLPHAMLFRGPVGIGKFQALLVLARGLLCERGPGAPCESCGPCKRARAETHPDLFVLDPRVLSLEQIPVGAITPRRDTDTWEGPCIGEFLSLKAHEGGWRIVIVREAERMNEYAQNAFLKTLEEPTANTLLALETSAPEALLPTVRSRLVEVRCRALDESALRAILASAGIADETAAAIAPLAEGSPGRALELARSCAAEIRASLEAVENGTTSAIAAARALHELEGEFPGRTPLAQSRARVRVVLDLLLARARAELRRAASAGAWNEGEAARLERRIGRWLQARADVDSNLSPEAILERALLVLEPSAKATPRENGVKGVR